MPARSSCEAGSSTKRSKRAHRAHQPKGQTDIISCQDSDGATCSNRHQDGIQDVAHVRTPLRPEQYRLCVHAEVSCTSACWQQHSGRAAWEGPAPWRGLPPCSRTRRVCSAANRRVRRDRVVSGRKCFFARIRGAHSRRASRRGRGRRGGSNHVCERNDMLPFNRFSEQGLTEYEDNIAYRRHMANALDLQQFVPCFLPVRSARRSVLCVRWQQHSVWTWAAWKASAPWRSRELR